MDRGILYSGSQGYHSIFDGIDFAQGTK